MTQKNYKSILVVNSEPDMSDLFAEMLLMDDTNYIVNTAFSGNECLLALKRDRPDMVLLDIELSDIDGWKLIEEIKEMEPQIPIVIITAKPPVIDDFLRMSMVSDYLMRPVTLDGLHMAVKDALEVPYLLGECIETVKNCKNEEEKLYLLFMLLKQNILDRKWYILMRQLYPDSKLDNHPETRVLLENLKGKIDQVHNEIECFKHNRSLIA